MKKDGAYPIIRLDRFVEAARDSGYKDLVSALAELIDNSFEANATEVAISILGPNDRTDPGRCIVVMDNGHGMSPSILRQALQFGGSTRFNSRKGVGRYGMGLPNSSLSQARRVEVYTWTRPDRVWWSYIDVDEIVSGKQIIVPQPRRRKLPSIYGAVASACGTVVIWSKCDRLRNGGRRILPSALHSELGRFFRKGLSDGKTLRINGGAVRPVDPLFIKDGSNLIGGVPYGPPLTYEVETNSLGRAGRSRIEARFVELPIEQWHSYSNEEKESLGISRRAGVSIVRAGREIDYGWFFMGGKRKENYDDWWRCEIQFDPALDELFGVTQTKQEIHPTEKIKRILSPDLEKIARELNGRVRKRYGGIRTDASSRDAERKDYLLDPPKYLTATEVAKVNSSTDIVSIPHRKRGRGIPSGLRYRIEHKAIEDLSFFLPSISAHEVVVLLNEEHPFFERVYAPLLHSNKPESRQFRQRLELLLFAAARAESAFSGLLERQVAGNLRELWSNALVAFLS